MLNHDDAQKWFEKLPLSDQKTLNTLDIIIDRRRLLAAFLFEMERLVLYHMNNELMSKIDDRGKLGEAIFQASWSEYETAWETVARDHPNAIPLFAKLSRQGSDYFWTNGCKDLTNFPGLNPWRDPDERNL